MDNLNKYIGKDYLHIEGKFHLRVLGIRDRSLTHNNDPFKDCVLDICGYYSYVPLINKSNGSINPKHLDEYYVEKTKASNILFYVGQK